MRKYETFFIVDPDLPDDANSVVDEKVKSVVSANGGSVIEYTPWGKKKLAYPIKKHTRGHYILMEYAGGPELVAELERNMRLDERVLKFITVKLEDRYDPEKEAARKASPPSPFKEDVEGEGAEAADRMEGSDEDLEEDFYKEEADEEETGGEEE